MVKQSNKRLTCMLTMAIACMSVAPVARADDWRPPWAIVNGTIVRGNGKRIDAGTVVIRDGRIVDVGADVIVPADAEVLDASGLFVYPGWIDAQNFLGISKDKRSAKERIRQEDKNPDRREGPLPATRFANRRGVRAHHRAAELFAPDEKQLAAFRDAGFCASIVSPRDGIFAGTSALLEHSGLPVRRSLLEPDVAMHCAFATGEDGEYPKTLLGVFAQFRQVLLDTQHHGKLQKYAERHPSDSPRVPVDPTLEALKPVLSGQRLVVFEANTKREIHRALNLAEEFGFRIAISGAKEAFRVVERLKGRRVPLIVSLKFDREPEHGKSKKRTGGAKDKEADSSSQDNESKTDDKKTYEPLKVREERRRLWEQQVRNTIALHDAGMPFALRTRDFEKPEEFFKSLRLVMDRGLPEAAVVAALTAVPAEICGIERQLGDLERDYVANLTILNAPLASKNYKVRYIFVAGRKFEIDEGDKKKEEKAESDGENGSGNDESFEADSDTGPDGAAGDELPAEIEADHGPSFASEIDADRIAKLRTGGNVLIRDATIMPITAPTMQRGSLLIQDGKIQQIAGNIEPPEGTTVIDAGGRFVIPGFVDAHSHLGIDAVNESPLAISAEVRIADVVNPTSLAIYRAVAGGTTTHHTMHGSANPIGGQNLTWKLKYKRPISSLLIPGAARTIKFATGENVTHANFPAARGKRFPVTRMGVEAVYREALEAARSYRHEFDAFQRMWEQGIDAPPVRRDLRLEALAQVLTGDLVVHAHCYRSEEILRLLGVAEDFGIRIGTLHHVLEGYRITSEIARHGCGASTFANDWAYKVEAYNAIPHNAAFMQRRGINTTVNSDSARTIRYLGQEAAKCVRWGGLSDIEALKLVTTNAAVQLGVDHRVGSLEVGKDGDVAVFNGHPLNTFSKCVLTLIDGEVHFEDARPEPVAPCGTLLHPGNADFTIPQTVHRAYAIVGATVHTITSAPITNATVVILEDRIHAVGKDVPVPPGAGVIDGAGLHVYPGLIDAGSRLGLAEVDSLDATRDHREIGAPNPHLLAASAIHPHSEHIRIARSSGITTALCRPDGGQIAGQSAIIRLEGWTPREMLLQEAFALHLTVPSLPVHLPEDREQAKKLEDEHKKQTKQLEEFFARARHYAKVEALADAARDEHRRLELPLEAMLPYMRGKKPVALYASRYKRILDTMDFAQKHSLKWILVGGRESWKLADDLAAKQVPVILSLPTTYPRGEFEPWDSVYRCAALLKEAGVAFCFASGSASMAYNFGMEVGMAVAHGLPQADAEYAVTMGAASILRLSDRLGSIEVGKQADLIVTTASPLQASCVVTHMFLAGAPVELTNMHTQMYERFRKRPEPDLPPAPPLVGPVSQTKLP